ncbi:hypothetical protein B0H12DRAFT_1136118 [Mycena haematopus]|nr:hypothetical protein B0H12DRAFT_1136118 [Mycena haematopus]
MRIVSLEFVFVSYALCFEGFKYKCNNCLKFIVSFPPISWPDLEAPRLNALHSRLMVYRLGRACPCHLREHLFG